jgi:hypothetical protein
VRSGQLRTDGREHLAEVVRGERRRERAPQVPHRVPQRPECPRRQQVVTGAGEHPPRTQQPGEGADQARLPDPRLLRDEHDRPAAGGGPVEGGVEHPKLGVAFEQRRHGGIVPAQLLSTGACAATAV